MADQIRPLCAKALGSPEAADRVGPQRGLLAGEEVERVQQPHGDRRAGGGEDDADEPEGRVGAPA